MRDIIESDIHCVDFFVQQWGGHFGERYTDRCNVTPESRQNIFDSLLCNLNTKSILEVGCNKGHNLDSIKAAFSKHDLSVETHGIEPQKKLCNRPDIICGDAYSLPWADNTFDMVFTSGVLIHIPPYKLSDALSEIHRVSKRYIMAIEYWSDEEVGKAYRDFENKHGCWSRPYNDIYLKSFPELKLVKCGDIRDIGDDGWGFSDCNYGIFEKTTKSD